MITKLMPKLTKIKAKSCFTAFLFLLVCSLQAQVKVSGYVKGQEGKSLPNATVILLPENLTVTTDKIGYFQFLNVSEGPHTINVFMQSYNDFIQDFDLIDEEEKSFPSIQLEYSPYSVNQGIITLTDDELEEDEGNSQSGISLLQSSRDVFSRAAAYELGGYWFKTRGLDNEYSSIYFNGILMNKQDDGRVVFGNWGGLNDVTRYPTEILEGAKISQYDFGSIGTNTYFETRASNYRKGMRLTYSSTNRSYRNRLMLSYFTGMSPKGWAFAFSASRRWAEEGKIEGTYYDAYAYFMSIEKKLNERMSLNFSAFGSPGRRSSNSPNTQEVYNLKGKDYNSYWGWDDGEKRNERIKKYHEPQLMLSHYWNINDKTSLKTTIGYQFGTNGGTRLDWFNANSPSPTYYRYLPSYGYYTGYTQETIDMMYNRWQNDDSYSQIDWDGLYNQNLAIPSQTYFGHTGRRAVYTLVSDNNDDKSLNINTHFSKEINPDWNMYVNLTYQNVKSHNYRKIVDIMGADFALDLDNFNENLPYNTGTPVAFEGDKVRYNYLLSRNIFNANWMNSWQIDDKFNVEVSTFISYTESSRDGKFQNGLYLNDSKGKSKLVHFVDVGMKSEVTYKINGKNYLRWNATYFTQSPNLDEIFPNARMNNLTTPDLKTRKVNSNELSYIHQSAKFKTRVTGYYSKIADDVNIIRYYSQGLALNTSSGQNVEASNAFVTEALTDVGQKYYGAEIGIEYHPTSTLSINAVGSLGKSTFDNDPQLYLSIDDSDNQGIYNFGKSYLKDYRLGNGPQIGASFGMRYSSPKYWWIGASANYLANSYLNPSPILRTENFFIDPTTGNPYYSPELGRTITIDDVNTILKQQKFDDQFMLNASVGKTFKLGKYYMGLSLNVNNILNNRDYVTGGFEQGRLGNFNDLYDDTHREYPLFGPKLWYDRGTTYYFNVYLRF